MNDEGNDTKNSEIVAWLDVDWFVSGVRGPEHHSLSSQSAGVVVKALDRILAIVAGHHNFTLGGFAGAVYYQHIALNNMIANHAVASHLNKIGSLQIADTEIVQVAGPLDVVVGGRRKTSMDAGAIKRNKVPGIDSGFYNGLYGYPIG